MAGGRTQRNAMMDGGNLALLRTTYHAAFRRVQDGYTGGGARFPPPTVASCEL